MTVKSSQAVCVVDADGALCEDYGPWHRSESLVRWSSVTKLFTAALFRSMVADGLLDWSTGLPDLGLTSAPAAVTVGDLVMHTSGLPRILPNQAKEIEDPYRSWTEERFDREVLGDLAALIRTPSSDDLAIDGGSESYSNVGYAVLGRLAERILGQAWMDAVADRVIIPVLGHPGSFVVADGQPELVEAKSVFGRTVPDWTSTGAFVASGGLASTVADLVHVVRASCSSGGHLAPHTSFHAWSRTDGVWWHNGGSLRSGSFLAHDPRTGSVGAAHSVGGFPMMAPAKAQKALEGVMEARRSLRDGGRS